MENTCTKHGYDNAERRRLDDQMGELSCSQAGEGRHKCAYCAYELGYKQACMDFDHALQSIKQRRLSTHI